MSHYTNKPQNNSGNTSFIMIVTKMNTFTMPIKDMKIITPSCVSIIEIVKCHSALRLISSMSTV